MPADRVIVRQGEIGTGFFIVASGSVRVVRDGETLADLGPGEFFGELSVLDGKPRNAQVVSREPTTCLALASWDFESVVREHPAVALAILRELAGRLRDPDRRASSLTRRHERPHDDRPTPAPERHRHLPVHRHRGFDEPRAAGRHRTLRGVARATPRRSCGSPSTTHGGVEQGTEGDSFFVVFDSAREAVAAALDGAAGARNRTVARRRDRARPDGSPLGRGGDGRRQPRRAGHQQGGPDRRRRPTAARSCSPRRPGRSSRRTCRPASRLRELGVVRLKDLPAPERLTPGRAPTACARSSRRHARRTPTRATCPPS